MSKDKYIEQLYRGYEYSSTQFDKSILFIASGAFGISFSFVDKIIDLSKAEHTLLLMLSWYIFATIVFIFTIAHYIAVRKFNQALKEYRPDDEQEVDEEKQEIPKMKSRKPDFWVTVLNISMIGGLFVGMLFLIIFVHLNI